MTTIELNRLQNALKSRATELEANVSSGRKVVAIETSADELDRIQHRQERDLAMGALDRNSKLLCEIRAALRRIFAGTFGFCLGCEERIGYERLEAMPWTASCIVCQHAADTVAAKSKSIGEDLLVSAS